MTNAAGSALVRRIVGQHADAFVVESIPPHGGHDVFEVTAEGGQVLLRGTDGVAQAFGLHAYLKEACGQQVTWDARPLQLPDVLPSQPPLRRTSPYRYRYHLNYCTFGYTTAFWDWARWEREIDWMALHGINLPLAITGLEGTWQRVYRRFGLDDERIRRFFGGPAHLPWHWMGCVTDWDGPLPQPWIDAHVQLQRQILARERELGMRPVLQGFAGHVPPELAGPGTQVVSWEGFANHLLNPDDPRFLEIATALIGEQTALYGTDHLYAADPFIEMVPAASEPVELRRLSRRILEGMMAGDPDAIWLLQGWPFHYHQDYWGPDQVEAVLTGVPDEHQVVLDLWAEKYPLWQSTRAFHGKPWIWSIVHTFGGRPGLFGDLERLANDRVRAQESGRQGQLVGIGMAMEALGGNAVAFEIATEAAFEPQRRNVASWLRAFVRRRYGRLTHGIEQAWEILHRAVYSGQHETWVPSGITARPTGARTSIPSMEDPPTEDLEALVEAWGLLLAEADEDEGAGPLGRDVVDVAQQVLAERARLLRQDAMAAYDAGDRQSLAAAARRLQRLLCDVDELLATRGELLLGRWLAEARRWGATAQERLRMEQNARRVVTTWGLPDSALPDYSARHWAGLVAGFYLPRLRLWLERLDEAVGGTFDEASFMDQLVTWEEAWITEDRSSFADSPTGDPLAVAKRLLDLYGAETLQRAGR